MSKTLSDVIDIKRRFLKSINLNLDFGRYDAIDGYILQSSTQKLLHTLGHHLTHTQQKAFTLTGPYGTGKSLLALTIASLAGGTDTLRNQAKAILSNDDTNAFVQYFSTDKPWLVLPITGKRSSIDQELKLAISTVIPETEKSKKSVIKQLKHITETNSEYEGVLLIIDELGKFLEYAAYSGEDVGFYQELAEMAARSKGKLVILGILHQAFEQYASRLGKDTQQEWAKVQGRYVDIPLSTTTDETLYLLSKAIEVNSTYSKHLNSAESIAQFIPNQQQTNIASVLKDCWPLHALTALMLGPSSRKRYGQNERSIFSFLASAEPLGFYEITTSLVANQEHSLYWPHHYWDYLRANFEPTILVSSDSHRWSLTLDALQRAESLYPVLHLQIIKTLGLLDLFRSSLGLYAKPELLYASIPATKNEITQALQELSQSSILIFRKHTESWAIYAGSDFDIEEAIQQAKHELGALNLSQIDNILELNPVIARRHYAEKGAMRWFDKKFVLEQDVSKHLKSFTINGSKCGEFLLVLQTHSQSLASIATLQKDLSVQAPQGVVIGISNEAETLIQKLEDLRSLDFIRKHRLELHTDHVAMREVDARIHAIRLSLGDTIQNLFNQAQWMYQDKLQSGNLTQIASEIANHIYSDSPIILSELVNRNHLSANAIKAQKDLLRAMLSSSHLENFGFESMSAPAGLYRTTLKTLGMHNSIDNIWHITKPNGSSHKSASAVNLWQAAEDFIFKSQQSTPLNVLYQLWTQAPYGIKKGLLPIFALAFYLANRKHLALYMDGVFTPDLTEATLDEWLQDPKRVSWRFVKLDSSEQDILHTLATTLSKQLNKKISEDPLDSARALVSIVYSIPMWTRRTERLPTDTKKLRQLLLHASDPHKVLFVDIPTLLNTSNANEIAEKVSSATTQLVNAFSSRLKTIEANLLLALDHDTADWDMLNQRSKNINHVGADFKLEAFISRIGSYKGQIFDIEGLLTLAIGKPTKDWTDHDLDAGEVQLLQWSNAFRRLEVLAHLRNKSSSRRGIGVIFGNEHAVTGSFDVAEKDQALIENISSQLISQLKTQDYKKEVFLAALAEAGAKILQDLNQVDG